MKKIYYWLLLAFLAHSVISAQISWSRVHPKLQDQIQDIAVIDTNTAVAVGSNGGIFSTTNGGTTWSTALPVTSVNLFAITYFGGNLWAVGAGGAILRSTDLSTSWTLISAPAVTGQLMAVTFIDTLNGWAAGELGVIYHTTDGGFNWTSQNSTPLQWGWFRDVYFLDANNGFVCGTNHSYGRTTDGGTNWTLTEAAGGPNLQTYFDIDFYDANNGWMVGDGDALITTNGGVSWSNNGLTHAAYGAVMYDIEMVSNQIWYISGSGGKMGRTSDGGTNWVYSTAETVGSVKFNMYACDFSSLNNGLTVGDGGVIFNTTDGTTWNSQIATITRNTLNGAYFFNNDTGYVVGSQGTILKTENGGISWWDDSSKLNTTNSLYDIYFPSDTVGYICGDAVFYSTMDGGTTWTKQTLAHVYYTVKFIDEDIGWIMGSVNNGIIAKTTNRGATWTTTVPPNASPIYDFDIINANTLVAVGFAGAIYKTTNSGTSWSVFTPRFTNDDLDAVEFTDDGVLGFAVSPSSMIYRTTDAGVSWDTTDARLTITNPIYDIAIINSQNIYVVGDQGSVYYSFDAGVSWNDMSDNMTSFAYNTIVATDRSHFWRVGGGGNVHFGIDATAGQTPAPSYALFPFNADIDIAVNATLKWKDSGAAAPTGYKVYFGTDGGGNSTPINIANGVDVGLVTTYVPTANMLYGTTYYWRIVPYNANGSTPINFCPIWSFKTRESLYWGGGGLYATGYFFANSDSAVGAPSQPVYSWIDPIANGLSPISSWTSGNGDDGYFGPVNLGISFPFFGENYTQAYIGSNGNITFSSGYSGKGTSLSIPNSQSPNNMIAALVMDLAPVNVAAKVYYGLVGGNFVVTWYHYSAASNSSDEITFQVTLYSNGYILTQYNDAESNFPAPASIANDALIGIENKYGTKGVQYRNNGSGGNIFGSPVAVGFGDNQSALPVELTSFTANAEGNTVTLNWQTATEVNNYGFEIERARNLRGQGTQNGNGDLEGYRSIGFVTGHGNSNSPKSYSYTDNSAVAGNYSYRLKQIDVDGQFEYSDVVEVTIDVPVKFELSQNYPNPFNPTTRIKYSIPTDSKVTLKLYDILGKEVAELVNEKKPAGQYTVRFNGANLSSGVYFYRIKAGNFTNVKKLLLMK